MTAAAPPKAALSEAERRQLTIMFCDLVDLVVLSTRLDPEDLRDVISAYHGACARSIDQYSGYVARYLGDEVLIYFGYPEAHEDDAGRAVRAALDLVQTVARLNDELGFLPISTCGCELASPPGLSLSAMSARASSRRWAPSPEKPPTLQRGCRPWPVPTASSSRR